MLRGGGGGGGKAGVAHFITGHEQTINPSLLFSFL